MTYNELIQSVHVYRPALYMETVLPRALREKIQSVLLAVLVLAVVVVLFGNLMPDSFLAPVDDIAFGVSLIVLAPYLLFFGFNALYAYYHFERSDTVLEDYATGEVRHAITYEVASFVYDLDPEHDITEAFFSSSYGRTILMRLGITAGHMEAYLSSDRTIYTIENIEIPEVPQLARFHIAEQIFKKDESFRGFLFSHGIQEKLFVGALTWVADEHREKKYKKRWWGKDQLGRLPSIGKEWSYGRAYTLERYGISVKESSYYGRGDASSTRSKEVRTLEAILSRDREANVLLMSEDRTAALEVVGQVARSIEEGDALPALEAKSILLFDGLSMVSATGTKEMFEQEFIKGMNEGFKAGNLIVVVQDLPAFIASAREIGSDVPALLDPYLSSDVLSVIALTGKDAFYRDLEGYTSFLKRFEQVTVARGTHEGVIEELCLVASRLETIHPVFFTYPTIIAIRESADRYFPSGVMPDKAIDLLMEVIHVAKREGGEIVLPAHVHTLVEAKTGIPLGEVGEKEKEKLLSLEDRLHDRVVGQHDAIVAISNAMRRVRSGIANPDRPIGSFLFLGPTGVGKTETAKALAELFFEQGDAMLRLDMSEYQSSDAIDKLIGSFGSGKSGVLTTLLKEKQYGVLLLDEFEKSSDEVRDLFLQIIDEGVFSDKSGKKVNARNTIIIATSNAGADFIWDHLSRGDAPENFKEELVDAIVAAGTFRPELINRFDGVVVFTPHDEDNLRDIARLMLNRLKKRMREKGVDLAINEELISYVVEHGYDPKFGARPMNRVIQEDIEKAIAEKLIKGVVQKGETLTLTTEDLEKDTQ